MNKMIKKIKTMKIFKKKNKSYENDIQEDMVPGFGTKERIESMNSVYGLKEKSFRRSHRRDLDVCLLYTSPSPRDQRGSRMPSSA